MLQTSLNGAVIAVRILVFCAGVFIILATLGASIKTFVLPRGVNARLTSWVFRGVGFFFRIRARRVKSYTERDKIMALYAPITLLILPLVVLSLIIVGYQLLYWALDPRPLSEAFTLSGSSLLTLGYASVDDWRFKLLEFSEAMLGLLLVALLIAYLPSIYGAFAKRETAVALLESYAGTPPSAAELIGRAYRTGELENLREFWMEWQRWFAEVSESHTSLAMLPFFRSPQPDRSWITAAGAVLDAAALTLAAVDIPWEPRAALCLRSGYLTLRQIADFFGIPYDPQPAPDDPISITRREFDAVCTQLTQQGVPLKTNGEQAWHDYAGWRVNYDTVLLALAALTMAPYAAWSSDRSAVAQRAGK